MVLQTNYQARSQKFAMRGYLGGPGAKPLAAVGTGVCERSP